ncbi:hypothetical protein ACHAXR_013548 [Thalassiosira sp. AJA248-18]
MSLLVIHLTSDLTDLSSLTKNMNIASYALFGLLGFGSVDAIRHEDASPKRPDLVLDAIEKKSNIYYVGIGSNMSRTKLENRSICGSKINILSMEPCVIKNHRLAFNMRGFPPLEPAMGSLEPLSQENTEALHFYEREECHAALILLSAEDYSKVYKSEGGGTGKAQGYEEIVVTAVPYDSNKAPVQGVAFRVREHARLSKDPCPSHRYMNILREGAKELGLKECYQQWLADHPVQTTSPLLTKIAINNLFFISLVSFEMKFQAFWKLQSWLVSDLAYVPPNDPSAFKRICGEVLTFLLLLPGAIPGLFLKYYNEARGTTHPVLKAMMNR